MAWNIDDDFSKIFEIIFKQLGFPDQLDSENPNVRKWSYGYSMTQGQDGIPIVRQWGTDFPEAQIGDPRNDDPLSQVDVDRANGKVNVIVELPGLTKESIRITGTETNINVKADYDRWNINHEIPISAKVDPSSAKAVYNNGVLDITLDLLEDSDPEGVDIQVN